MRITTEFNGTDFQPDSLPPIGNGELSLLIDPDGTMSPEFRLRSGWERESRDVTPGIRRAGWRWNRSGSAGSELFPFGCFTQELPELGTPVSRRQTLDTRLAEVTTVVRYGDGTVITSEIFCHARENLVVVRKCSSRPVPYRFRHRPEHRRLRMTPLGSGVWNCLYDLDELREEKFALFADAPGLQPEDGGLGWTGVLTAGIWIFAWGESAVRRACRLSPDELRQEHRQEWEEFYRRCRQVELPVSLRRCYETSLYHLKISTTRWSIPTGLFDTHWHGRYFAFDELFILRGLLSAGCYPEARRIPAFRIATFESARRRACRDAAGDGSCLYPWEAIEDGSEGGPAGFWRDHVFHNAHVALGIAEYAAGSGDTDLLRAGGLQVIRSCALFFERHMLYESGPGRIIGSCTDLERLGEHRRNPFMTTCAAIALFRKAAELSTLPAEAERFRRIAAGLELCLPEENGRFVAYPGGPANSIGLLSGFYPYGIFPGGEKRSLAALRAFVASERQVGNMYATGSSVCAWYRLWKCMAMLHAGMREAAAAELEQLSAETGCWGELFEIREKSLRPFFATAEGIFLSAAHQLYQNKEEICDTTSHASSFQLQNLP